MKTTGVQRKWRIAAVAFLVSSVLFSAGCSNSSKPASWQGAGSSPGAVAGSGSSAPQLSTVAVVSPATDATEVVAITDVKYTSEDPQNTSVTVTGPDGAQAKGTLDKDGQVWHPQTALSWGTKYQITVTGTASAGKSASATSDFTTMAQPAKLVRATSFLGDNQTVGVGMPLIIQFSRAIATQYRAEVERRMTVTATPVQEGSWRWISATEAHYRPAVYWAAYSKVFYQVALAGVPLGDGYYGRSDFTVDLKIGRQFIMTVSNQTKQMTVQQDGKVIKTIPVSLGKPSTPSSSGTMVVTEKKRHTVFDTMDELGPINGYRTNIDFAQRITQSGQFIHAAPWSEGVQGKTNVSHGCVNVSMALGAWLFDRTLMGDPITVSGTEQKLKDGNGWTDWNMSFDDYKKGSAR